jgi:hypothetical protein
MNPRTKIVLVTIGAMISSAAGGIVALRMVGIANADETVPGFLPSLIVVALLMTVALLAWAATLRNKLPPHRP